MKWLAITVIIILALALAGGGYFLWQQTDKLGEAESEIVVLEGNVETLEGNVATLEGEVSTLETNLADSEAEVLILEAELAAAQSQIETLQDSVAAAQALYDTLKSDLNISLTSLDKKIELGLCIIRLWAATCLGDDPEWDRLADRMPLLIGAVDDAELDQHWQDKQDALAEGNNAKWNKSYGSLMRRIAELLEEDMKAIGAQL